MKLPENTFLVIIIIGYFILKTEGIAQHIPTVWTAPLLFIFLAGFLFLLRLKKTIQIKLIKEARWIILSLIILSIFLIINYGNFRLDALFQYLLFSIPFYIIGFYWGVRNKTKYFQHLVIIYFTFLATFLLTRIFQLNSFSSIQRQQIVSLFYKDINNVGLIFFFPFAAFVSTITFSFYIEEKHYIGTQLLMLILFSTCILFFVISTFAAPVFLILVTIFVYYYAKTSSKNKLKLFIAIPFLGLSGYGIIYLLGSGIFGNFGALTSKANGALLLLNSESLFNEEVLNILTSDRWTAILYSIQQFFASPIYGHGAYLESVKGMLGDISKYTTVSGGHNFIFDILAFFGIFGIPIIMIMIKFIRDAFKYYRLPSLQKKEKRTALIFASLMTSVLFSNIFNSWFLFSSFDNFIFLCSGFFLGRLYFNKTNYTLES